MYRKEIGREEIAVVYTRDSTSHMPGRRYFTARMGGELITTFSFCLPACVPLLRRSPLSQPSIRTKFQRSSTPHDTEITSQCCCTTERPFTFVFGQLTRFFLLLWRDALKIGCGWRGARTMSQYSLYAVRVCLLLCVGCLHMKNRPDLCSSQDDEVSFIVRTADSINSGRFL